MRTMRSQLVIALSLLIATEAAAIWVPKPGTRAARAPTEADIDRIMRSMSDLATSKPESR